MTGTEATANVLGALALLVQGSTVEAVAAVGYSETAAAALSALAEFLDRPTLDRLRSVLGLTPSGAVRLVDRLEADGLVTRGPGADGRSRSVVLTAKGKRAAARIQAARRHTLGQAIDGLSAEEQASLHTLTSKVLSHLVQAKVQSGRAGHGGWTCRMCDFKACERDQGHCPAATAARTSPSATAARTSPAAARTSPSATAAKASPAGKAASR